MKREDIIEHAIGIGLLACAVFFPALAIVLGLVLASGRPILGIVGGFGRVVIGFVVKLIVYLVVAGAAASYFLR